jgi:hypothetical protein
MTCSGFRLPNRQQIVCSKDSFSVAVGGRTIFLAGFDEIVRVWAWKRDEVTTDLICMEVEVAGGEAIQLNEDMVGFDVWADCLVNLPGAVAGWREYVVQPPFERNETLLYERQDQG